MTPALLTRSLFTNVTFYLLIFFSSFSCLFAQVVPAARPNNHINNFSRWVIRPAAYPYAAFSNKYIDDQGLEHIDVGEHGAEGFLRFSYYRPGGGLEYGLDLGLSQRYETLRHQRDERLTSSSLTQSDIIIGPVISYAKPGHIENEKHLKLTGGISFRYTIDRALRFNTATISGFSRQQLVTQLPFFRRNNLFWHIGVGSLRERFSLSRKQSKPVELSLFAFLPLFDQANHIVSDSTVANSAPLGNAFQGLKRRGINIGVMYTETIDFNRNGKALQVNELVPLIDSEEAGTFRTTQPLVSGAPPWRKWEGVFSFLGTYQSGIEKVDSNFATSEVTSLRPSIGWRATYTVHFALNRDNYFGPNTQGYFGGSKALLGIFAGAGVHEQVYRFDSPQRYRSFIRTTVFGEAGIRLGSVKSIMGFAGVGYQEELRFSNLYDEQGLDSLGSLNRFYYYAGVLIRDILTVRMSRSSLTAATNGKLSLDHFTLSAGFGF